MLVESPRELPALLARHSRLLGLDVGSKTIGLALSDGSRMVATPMETIIRSKFSKDVQRLKAIVEEHKIGAMVVGYPINMDGSEGPRCQSTRQFCRNVAGVIELPLLLWDERMSTMAVTRSMLEADLSRARRSEMVDKLAAGYILQSVLDYLKQLESKA